MVWYISLVQLFNVHLVTKYQTSNFNIRPLTLKLRIEKKERSLSTLLQAIL